MLKQHTLESVEHPEGLRIELFLMFPKEEIEAYHGLTVEPYLNIIYTVVQGFYTSTSVPSSLR